MVVTKWKVKYTFRVVTNGEKLSPGLSRSGRVSPSDGCHEMESEIYFPRLSRKGANRYSYGKGIGKAHKNTNK